MRNMYHCISLFLGSLFCGCIVKNSLSFRSIVLRSHDDRLGGRRLSVSKTLPTSRRCKDVKLNVISRGKEEYENPLNATKSISRILQFIENANVMLQEHLRSASCLLDALVTRNNVVSGNLAASTWRIEHVAARFMETSKVQQNIPVPYPFKSRKLGSFEKMLAKQRPNSCILSTPHVWTAVIDGNMPYIVLCSAVAAVLSRHPMLRAAIKGTGLPKEVVLETIRKSSVDEDPLVFVEVECDSLEELAERIVDTTNPNSAVSEEEFDNAWISRMEHNLENASFHRNLKSPNWKVEVIQTTTGSRSALIFTMNHAIEDQKSANMILKEILSAAAAVRKSKSLNFSKIAADSLTNIRSAVFTELPHSMESALLENSNLTFNRIKYVLSKMTSGFHRPMLIHHHFPESMRKTLTEELALRSTICIIRHLSESELNLVMNRGKERNLTLTSILSAAALFACSDVSHAENCTKWHQYKFLLAMDMRKFAAHKTFVHTVAEGNGADWTNGTVACAGGAMDWIESVPANSGKALKRGVAEAEHHFWRVAERYRFEVERFVENFVFREAVAVFDWGMKSIEIGDVCERESRNPSTLGRAYTCGVSNMGRFELEGNEERVRGLYYATSHSPWGCLYQLSCGTVDNQLCLTFQFVDPIVSREMGNQYADAFISTVLEACVDKK